MRFATVPALALLCGLMIGCGQSSEDKAQDKVCDARADIAKQVDKLSSLTLATVTTKTIQDSLSAIGNDIKKIGDAQGDLSKARRQEAQDANKEFTNQVQSIVADLGTSVSAAAAKDQLTKALGQLKSAYQQAYAKLDC